MSALLDESTSERMTISGESAPEARDTRLRPQEQRRRSLVFRVAIRGRDALIDIKRWYYRHVWHMDLHPTCKFSLKVNLDFTNPRGVHVGEGTYLAFDSAILAHDMARLIDADTTIGRNCFVGAHSIIMPGVTVGDECIIGAGAVVTRDVPSHCIVAGNPAQIVKTGIRTREWGILLDVYERATVAAESQND